MDILFVAGLIAVSGILAWVIAEGGTKKPCTCAECRPDLHPEIIAQLDQQAAYLRAKKRSLEAQQEYELTEAQLNDQRQFFKQNKLS